MTIYYTCCQHNLPICLLSALLMVYFTTLIFVCCQSFPLVISHDFQTMGKNLPSQVQDSPGTWANLSRERNENVPYLTGSLRAPWRCWSMKCVTMWGEKQTLDVCLLELFLVGNPRHRKRFDTEIDVIRLHFRSASRSCVAEDGSQGTERETDVSLRKLLWSPREKLMMAWSGAAVVGWRQRDQWRSI